MAFPWAAVLGAASSFLGGRAKAPRNPFLDYMIRSIGKSEGIVQNINFEDLDQRTLEEYRKQATRAGDLAISRQNASDFATEGTPLADSERGVARGVIGKAVGDAIGAKAADLEATRHERMLDAWGRVFGMGQGGFGAQNTQNQANMQAQSNATNSIFQLANAFIGNRAAPAASTASRPADPWMPPAYGDADDATVRRLKNEGIFR